jgi:epoxyqueuosine reductase
MVRNTMVEDRISMDILQKAVEFGASLAGFASVQDLKKSPTHGIYDKSPYYEGYSGLEWPEEPKTVLVLALEHRSDEPELDWWSEDIPGRTPGNRILMKISRKLKKWLKEEHDINAEPLPYPVEKGGIFLKDAAVLAGLGIIGKNNLLITPEYGPRVRLRALFLDEVLEPTRLQNFSPCAECDRPCFAACPENAFSSGKYLVSSCEPEMQRNRDYLVEVAGDVVGIDSSCVVEKFCRACEFACPVHSQTDNSPEIE